MSFLGFFLFFLFLPFTVSGLIITEVQVEGESVDECYIKIYNSSEKSIDISGFGLRKKTSTGNDSSVRLFPSGSIIEGNGYFVWASSRKSSFPEKIDADVISTQYLSYNNSVALFNNSRELIDALAWGSGENQYSFGSPIENPSKGQVIKRVKENNSYISNNDNSLDFSLYPPPSSPLEVKETSSSKKEEDLPHPFIISLFSSIILASIILFIKKNGRTQSL